MVVKHWRWQRHNATLARPLDDAGDGALQALPSHILVFLSLAGEELWQCDLGRRYLWTTSSRVKLHGRGPGCCIFRRDWTCCRPSCELFPGTIDRVFI